MGILCEYTISGKCAYPPCNNQCKYYENAKIGYTACWHEKDNKHCRMPVNHTGKHIYT